MRVLNIWEMFSVLCQNFVIREADLLVKSQQTDQKYMGIYAHILLFCQIKIKSTAAEASCTRLIWREDDITHKVEISKILKGY